MTHLATSRRATGLFVAGALVIAPFLVQQVSALSASAKEGDKCTKVGATTPGRLGVTLKCTRIGTTKTLKWKRTVTKPTVSPIITTSQIVIDGFAFSVAGNIKSTDELRVTNRDGSTHTVTSDNGVFDVTVDGGATRSMPTLNPGTYAFHCKIHTSMQGTLTVR